MSAKRAIIRPWTEVVDTLYCFSVEGDIIRIKVGERLLELPKSVMTFQEKLHELVGKKVAVLKTDIPAKPFIIRQVGDAIQDIVWVIDSFVE